MGREDLADKPEKIRANIVEGRLSKFKKTLALLEQDYLMDSSKTVAEVLKEAVAKLGENIQLRRFERFTLGEGMETEVDNFAEEVAKQTEKKDKPKEKKEQKKEEKKEEKKEPEGEVVQISAKQVGWQGGL